MKSSLSCPVCGYMTVSDEFDICAICGWELDFVQGSDPDYRGGANTVSIREAQAEFGRCSTPPQHRRAPGQDDIRDPSWRPLLQPIEFNVTRLRNVVLDPNADARDRADAVRLIGRFGDVESVDLVIQQLHNADSALRQAAIRALAQIPDERARTAIRSLFHGEPPPEVLESAVEAAGQQHDVDSVPLLVEAAKRASGFQVAQIAFALCRIDQGVGYAGARQVFDLVHDEWRNPAADIMNEILKQAHVSAGPAQRQLIEELLQYITRSI